MSFLPPSQKGFSGSLTGLLEVDEVVAAKENVVAAVGAKVVGPKFITGGGVGNFTSLSSFELAKKLGRPPLDGAGGGASEDIAGGGTTFGSGVGTRTGPGGTPIDICCAGRTGPFSLFSSVNGCVDGLGEEAFEDVAEDLGIEKGREAIGNMLGSSPFEASMGGA